MKAISMVFIPSQSTMCPLILLLIPMSSAGQIDGHKVTTRKMLIKMTGIQQPASCSEFLDNLEVKITTASSKHT